MARTQAGRTLTEAHRQGQLRIRARAISDFALLWPLWTGDEASFQQMTAASLPLIRGYHGLSASLAGGYFDAFRSAEDVGGSAVPRQPDPLDEAVVLGTLHVTGAEMTGRALAAGKPPREAMRAALTRTSGTVTRFALAGGRDTLLLSVAEDRQARGWARVVSGRPCPFCAMLASRGAAYLSEGTADFQAHDHCSCAAEPHYDGAALPAETHHLWNQWQQAQRDAREAGDLNRGTSNDALNAFRRYLAAQQ